MAITYRGTSSARNRASLRARRAKLLTLALPVAALVLSLFLMAIFGRRLLLRAAVAPIEEPSLVPLFVSAAVFLLAAGALVVLQARRIAERAAGPENRLIQAIRRVRTGDVAFRVHLRSGDLLADLADEFNGLLDWLNVNPPAGVITGSDVVEVEEVDQVHGAEVDPEAPVALVESVDEAFRA